MSNPLLESFLIPQFSVINNENMLSAVNIFLCYCRKRINKIMAQNDFYTWKNLCTPLEDLSSDLNCIVNPLQHLNAVNNTMELRKIVEICHSLLADYETWLGQHKGLYTAWLNIKNNQDYYQALTIEKKKTIDNTLQEFQLSGIELPKNQKKRYKEIVVRLSDLSLQYSNNVLDASQAWQKLITNKNELDGMSEKSLSLIQENANKKNLHGWLVTLDLPTYKSILTRCKNRRLREEIYWAYNTRASDTGPNAKKWDNSKIIEEKLMLRDELAQLLGFASYSDKTVISHMAPNSQEVIKFLNLLVKRVKSKGQEEFFCLKEFIKNHYNVHELQPWDIAYYSEKQKKHLYGISEENIRPFFPIEKVLYGMFEVVRRIFGITTKERYNLNFWHPDVRCFDIFGENLEFCGSFYLDLFSRDNKKNGAWMNVAVNRMKRGNGKIQKPVAYLITNFRPAVNSRAAALLTHEDVITLFHEFGHVLHLILTKVDILGVSGINGVPLDAVEFPSQFLENWCWEPQVLSLISEHYQTGDPLPKTVIDNLVLSKNYQASLFLLRQLELSLIDFLLHTRVKYYQNVRQQILDIIKGVQQQVSVITHPKWYRMEHAFSHIFSDGYESSYYSYLWSKVLATDAYSRFKKEGIFNRDTGKDFLEKILSCGGSEDIMVLFKRFLGRAPTIDALLSHYNI
ncbi:MAG: oligopeptidase A [Candidatus Dasytiphilus stammeri]